MNQATEVEKNPLEEDAEQDAEGDLVNNADMDLDLDAVNSELNVPV